MAKRRNKKAAKGSFWNYWLGRTPRWLKLLGLGLLFLLGLFLYQRVKTTYYHYKDFGILLPSGDYIHGIDVSKYQGKIDWKEVSDMNINGATIDFAFVKATEGTSLKDRYFDRNWRELEKTRIKQGAYHFFRCSKDGAEQARFFLKHYEHKAFHMPPVLDIEENNGVSAEKVRERAKAWIQTVENTTGRKPLIYSNPSFYKDFLAPDPFFEDYPFWIAHYYRLRPSSVRDWAFWQHSDRGHVNGIGGFVDFNVYKGSLQDLEQFIRKR